MRRGSKQCWRCLSSLLYLARTSQYHSSMTPLSVSPFRNRPELRGFEHSSTYILFAQTVKQRLNRFLLVIFQADDNTPIHISIDCISTRQVLENSRNNWNLNNRYRYSDMQYNVRVFLLRWGVSTPVQTYTLAAARVTVPINSRLIAHRRNKFLLVTHAEASGRAPNQPPWLRTEESSDRGSSPIPVAAHMCAHLPSYHGNGQGLSGMDTHALTFDK